MVKKIVNISFYVVLPFLFFSCKKEKACFKSVGDITTIEHLFEEEIDSLFLYDDLNYILIPSEQAKVEIIGGENLISLVDFSLNDKKLTVKNDNKCKFLRSYEKSEITAKIYVNNITYIDYIGSNQLRSNDTLVSNELRFFMREGAGEVDLLVSNSYMSAVNSYGFGNFMLRGRSITTFLNCASHSYCDAREFQTENQLVVNSNTIGDMLINADKVELKAEIYQRGNIKYIGNPDSIEIIKEGSGELLKID